MGSSSWRSPATRPADAGQRETLEGLRGDGGAVPQSMCVPRAVAVTELVMFSSAAARALETTSEPRLRFVQIATMG